MTKFKLGFRNKSAPEQLDICERGVKTLSALAPELLVDVNLARLQDEVAAARASHDRVSRLRMELRAEVARRNSQLNRARNRVRCDWSLAALRTPMTPAALLALKLQPERPKAPVGLADEPTITLAESRTEGAVSLRWTRSVRRCLFEVDYRAESAKPDQWQRADGSFRQGQTIKGLTSGVKYWFRVRAFNAHGYSPWSQMATARVK